MQKWGMHLIDRKALREHSSDFRCAIFAMLASVMKADGVFARYKHTLCKNRVWLRKPVAHKNEAGKQGKARNGQFLSVQWLIRMKELNTKSR